MPIKTRLRAGKLPCSDWSLSCRGIDGAGNVFWDNCALPQTAAGLQCMQRAAEYDGGQCFAC